MREAIFSNLPLMDILICTETSTIIVDCLAVQVINQVFYEFPTLTFENINGYQTLLLMFNFRNSLLPRSFGTSLYKTTRTFLLYFTRCSNHNRSQYTRINIKGFSIFCIGPTLWSNLSPFGHFKHFIFKNACHITIGLHNNIDVRLSFPVFVFLFLH